MATGRKKPRSRAVVIVSIAAAVLGVGAVMFVRHFLAGTPPPQKKVVQEIQVIRPPPPPPDEPPPPPPPEEKVDVPDPQKPDPTPDNNPPPSEQLGLDTEGGAGGDAFGLAGHKGGRDLLASGGSVFAWYGGLIKNELLECLGDVRPARNGKAAIVGVWIREDGALERVRILKSSGNAEWDRQLDSKMSACQSLRMSQPPPADTPQPISFHIGPHT